MANDLSTNGDNKNLVTQGFLIPFILITSLFFLWGVAHGMLDTLNKHFQEMLHLTKAVSATLKAEI